MTIAAFGADDNANRGNCWRVGKIRLRSVGYLVIWLFGYLVNSFFGYVLD
jgi:hypothetical protein